MDGRFCFADFRTCSVQPLPALAAQKNHLHSFPHKWPLLFLLFLHYILQAGVSRTESRRSGLKLDDRQRQFGADAHQDTTGANEAQGVRHHLDLVTDLIFEVRNSAQVHQDVFSVSIGTFGQEGGDQLIGTFLIKFTPDIDARPVTSFNSSTLFGVRAPYENNPYSFQ